MRSTGLISCNSSSRLALFFKCSIALSSEQGSRESHPGKPEILSSLRRLIGANQPKGAVDGTVKLGTIVQTCAPIGGRQRPGGLQVELPAGNFWPPLR